MIQLAPRPGGLVEIAVGNVPGIEGAFPMEALGMGDVLTEVVELPEEFRRASPQSPSHLVVVTRVEERGAFGMLFGGDFLADSLSIIAFYRPETQMLECFHCGNCAAKIAQWVKEMQSEWEPIFASRYDESEGKRPQRTKQ